MAHVRCAWISVIAKGRFADALTRKTRVVVRTDVSVVTWAGARREAAGQHRMTIIRRAFVVIIAIRRRAALTALIEIFAAGHSSGGTNPRDACANARGVAAVICSAEEPVITIIGIVDVLALTLGVANIIRACVAVRRAVGSPEALHAGT